MLAVQACDRPSAPTPAADAAPTSVDQVRVAAEQILRETGIPGAGLALVRAGGVEWAGGVGLADRDARTPVTADTHFRVGSISKTFVAMALVQQYEDGAMDIEAPVSELAPDVAIDNPWNQSSPVTVLQLLQHTAGFDDMHFTEMYNLHDAPGLPLVDVLRRNPASRRVRWRPGTRMSYSNPGYAVAAHVLEKVTDRAYEDVIEERIFGPLGMRTSSFELGEPDLPMMAKGYDSPTGPPVPFSQIYLRPAGNLHTSPAELAVFVQMLLNWGETTETLVIDPEYLSNMERPRTSIAAKAGLIYGYGTGIASRSLAGFPVLGHGGGIDGFSSIYGYSAARDVGWVVLLNGTYAPLAIDRLSGLALAYLKREVEPPAKPELAVAPDVLAGHAGYYHPEGSRNEVFGAMDWLTGGTTLGVEGNRLVSRGVLGGRQVPRWRVELVRAPVAASLTIAATVPIALVGWLVHAGRARPAGFWLLKLALACIPAAVVALVSMVLWAPAREWGEMTMWTRLTYLGSWALPLASLVALALLVDAWRRGAGRWVRGYALLVTAAGLTLSAFIAAWGLVGLRPWAY